MTRKIVTRESEPSDSSENNTQPLAERTFGHPHQRHAIDVTVKAVTRPGGQQLVAVWGPPGAGKSRTCAIVDNVLAHRWRVEMEADPEIRPVVMVEAPAAVGKEFAWREFLKELLGALGDPAVDRLVGDAAASGHKPEGNIRPGRLGANELLRIAIRRYVARKVRVLLIDEAQHMAVAPGRLELRRNLDILKGFANKTGVRIVLFGTYELLEFHRASAQLARRTLDVHLPRYHWAVEHEREAFKAVARAMLNVVEGLEGDAVESSLESCYERSLGCIGELRDWLVQAEFEYRTSGRPWSACLADTAPSVSKSIEMYDEIEASEQAMRTSRSDRNALRTRLGLPALSTRSTPTAATCAAASARRPRRIGRRNPTRDKVGSSNG